MSRNIPEPAADTAPPPVPATKGHAKAAAAEEMVEIFIPRGAANEEPNLLVSVNSVNYVLPRGKKSTVPAHIAAEIQRAWEAQEALDAKIDKMLEMQK